MSTNVSIPWLRYTILALIATLMVSCAPSPKPYAPAPPSFEGQSLSLKRTQVVPTLDTPNEPGKNVIWCASFQAAWKKLESDSAKEPIVFQQANDTAARLNASDIPDAPDGELYAAAGWESDGLLETIIREKAARFPGSAVPDFSNVAPDSFVAYGYLQSACKFTVPYFNNDSSLKFRNSSTNATDVRSFGIRKRDEYAYQKLREQVKVLFLERDQDYKLRSFALDLCKDSPHSQVVVASVPAGASLQDMLLALEKRIAEYPPDSYFRNLGPNDVLLVPEIAFHIAHDFDSLLGQVFSNAALDGQKIDIARQDLEFRLDRSGVELASEAQLVMASGPSEFICDGPFLIYLKKRGAKLPYFAMWVDNEELLTKW